MSTIPINSKVIALASMEDGIAHSFGEGIYVGDEVPPPEINSMLNEMNFPNPKIKLDSGQIVWGCECYWGPKEEMLEGIAKDSDIMTVDINEYRKKFANT